MSRETTAGADTLGREAELAEQLEEIANENRRLKKINRALMGQVERSMDYQGNAYTMFQTAITLEHKVNERTASLRALNDELASAKNSMSHYIAAASHDLLQPLNAARIFLSTLRQKPLRDDCEQLVQNIDASMSSTEELLTSLLEISKLDAKALPSDITTFPLHRTINNLYREFLPLASKKGLALRRRESSCWVSTDETLLSRILRNFLSNAIRYTDAGFIRFGCVQLGDDVIVGVWDSGTGIPENQMSLIFQEFRRLRETGGNENGVGLGLAIVERIARQLNLEIVKKSAVGRGSYFGVRLPKAQPLDTEDQISLDHDVSERSSKSLANLDIAILDNDETILRAMTELLQGWGCKCAGFTHGNDLVAAVESGELRPSVIIADYLLDGGKIGVDTVRDLRAGPLPDIPLIVVTANREDSVQRRVREMQGYLLQKPLQAARLRSLLEFLFQQ